MNDFYQRLKLYIVLHNCEHIIYNYCYLKVSIKHFSQISLQLLYLFLEMLCQKRDNWIRKVEGYSTLSALVPRLTDLPSFLLLLSLYPYTSWFCPKNDRHKLVSMHSTTQLRKYFEFINQFQKISMLPPQRVFCFAFPHPPGNSSLASYLPSKSLASRTTLPLGISSDLPWREYGYFLEPSIGGRHSSTFVLLKS